MSERRRRRPAIPGRGGWMTPEAEFEFAAAQTPGWAAGPSELPSPIDREYDSKPLELRRPVTATWSYTEPFEMWALQREINARLAAGQDMSVIAAELGAKHGKKPGWVNGHKKRNSWMEENRFRDLRNLPRGALGRVLTGSVWRHRDPDGEEFDPLRIYGRTDGSDMHVLPLPYYGMGKNVFASAEKDGRPILTSQGAGPTPALRRRNTWRRYMSPSVSWRPMTT